MIQLGVQHEKKPLNNLQVLWLKELGIEQLWGHALQVHDPVLEQTQTAVAPEVTPAALERGGVLKQQSQVSNASIDVDQIPPHAMATYQANASSLTPTSPTPTSVATQGASRGKHFEVIRESMSRRQASASNRKSQRDEVFRQADRPQVDSLVWDHIQQQVQGCQACELSQTRTQVVFGELGSAVSLMVVDEMPGKEDDLSGHMFVGKSGELLNNMLAAIGLDRDKVLLTSLLKCRSAEAPSEYSLTQCQNYLLAQIQIARPRCILVLGRVAFTLLGQEPGPFERLRGQDWFYRLPDGQEIPVVVSYHPSYLMIHQADKALAWQDLKQLARLLVGSARPE